jgi:hypothetical protein
MADTKNKELFLHVGWAKTASSALQEFFASNLNELSANGIWYPRTGRGPILRNGQWKASRHHHQLAVAAVPGSVPSRPTQTWQEYLLALSRELQDRPETKVLISSEVFCGGPAWEKLGMLRDIFSHIHVIVYLRSQSQMAMSAYGQFVKTCVESRSFEEVIADTETLYYPCIMRGDYYNHLKNWRKTLGGDGSVIVRVYERQQLYQENILADFMHHVFGAEITSGFVRPSLSGSNLRLNRDALEFKRLINEHFTGYCDKYLESLLRYSESHSAETRLPFSPHSIISPQRQLEISEEHRAGNEKIAKEILGREDGRLFYDPPLDLDEPWQSYPGLLAEKAFEIFQTIVSGELCNSAEPEDVDKAVTRRLISSLLGKHNAGSDARRNPKSSVRMGQSGLNSETSEKTNPQESSELTADYGKVLYLHIGFPKTGTTALQDFFVNNEDALGSSGVWYAQAGRRKEDWEQSAIWSRNKPAKATQRHLSQQHHYLFGPVTGHSIMKLWDWDQSLELLRKEVEFTPFSKFLCSSEILTQGIEFLELFRLYEVFDHIKVVAYVRRQDAFASSLYEQEVKTSGSVKSMQYPLRKALAPDYYSVLSQWASLVEGRGELIVCPYEKQQFHGPNIFSDFFYRAFHVELDVSRCKIPASNPNPRLNRDALEFKRLINSCCDVEQAAPFLGGLLSYSGKFSPGTAAPFNKRSLLSPEQEREICLQFEESNAQVARQYLGREDGRLFYEPLPALDTSWESYPGLTREKVEEIISFWKEERPGLVSSLGEVLKTIPDYTPKEDVSYLNMMRDTIAGNF